MFYVYMAAPDISLPEAEQKMAHEAPYVKV